MRPELVCLLAFLVGAIPFGLLIGKLKGIDLREKGSGNIGATNAMRQLGKPLGALVFVLDALKGGLPVFLAHRLALSPEWVVGAGFAAVFGHIYSPFVRFKGGKGVATALGVLLGLDWRHHVKEDQRALRKGGQTLVGDPAKLRRVTGYEPTVTFAQMIRLMLLAEGAKIP